MRIFFIILFTGIAGNPASGQQNIIDSLINDLKNHHAEDTIRLELLNKIAFSWHQVNPDSGLLYATQQIALAKKINHRRYEGKGYFNRGINFWAKGMYDKTLSAYKESRTILEQAGTVKNVANLNNSMAVTYQSLSDYPSALTLYFDNLKLFEKLKDTYMIALTCSNIGIVYKYLKQYDKSISFYDKAISINEAAGNKKELADNYGNKGNVYEAEGNLATAIEFYQKQSAISRSVEYIKGIASGNAGLGTAYISSGKYTDALKPLEEALAVYLKLGDRNNEATVLKSLGDIYFANPQQYKTAADYYKRSLSIFNEIENLYGQSQNWQQLALIYEKEGD
jgi:tetratricopeptide (TPR) repeat protein